LVKVRGNRVELGEVENRLREFPGVLAAAAVLVRQPPQDDTLGAFVVRAPGCDASDEDMVAFCRETLPDYMAPGRVWALAELPVNQNGKVDRSALAELAVRL
jgi:acyl-coenzyme A synthetase/AMP-(fatty) acid ligase